MSESISPGITLPPPSNRYILAFAPPVAPAFWGEIVFRYQDGRVVGAEVREAIKA